MTEPYYVSKFDEELPGLLDEIEEIVRHGGNHKIDDVLGRLTTYDNELDDIRQPFAQNFKDALTMLSSPPPAEYLMDVEIVDREIIAFGPFAVLYKGTWKGKQVMMKKFRHVRPGHAFQEKEPLKHYASFCGELTRWNMVSTFEHVWPLLGFTMWLDRDETTVFFALVSPLAEGDLELNFWDRRSLEPKKFAKYFHDAARGLQSLHNHGVIHGNICSKNILQNKGHCYLVGSDLSKLADSSSLLSFAPVDGSAMQLVPSTDIFAFGFTMYQILDVLTLSWTIKQEYIVAGHEHPALPRTHLGHEWDAIWDLVLCCTSNDDTSRPTALELAESLKAICEYFV